MALSVRSTGCTSEIILFFAFCITGLASAFLSAHLSPYLKDANTETKGKHPQSGLHAKLGNVFSEESFKIYWIHGYPLLIGIWSKITGIVGVATSKRKNSRNMCWITTFFICSLVLLGSESYVIYDLIPNYIQPVLKRKKSVLGCASSKPWWINCNVHLGIEICLVILAVFMIMLSLWCVVCCCGSLCCRNQVEQEPDSDSDSEEQQAAPRQPTTAQGLMAPGAAVMVPMVPMTYNSGVPAMPYSTVPTMQGHMQPMQGNVPMMMAMAPGSYPPVTGVPVVLNAAGQQRT